MTDTFDWERLAEDADNCDSYAHAADLLRTRIEAAFVPRVKYDHPTFVHRVDRARYHLAMCSADRIGAMISFSDEENTNLTARAEAAEARVKVLEEALRLFEWCAYPVCTSINPRGHGWMPEKYLDYALSVARAALGGEHVG